VASADPDRIVKSIKQIPRKVAKQIVASAKVRFLSAKVRFLEGEIPLSPGRIIYLMTMQCCLYAQWSLYLNAYLFIL
jgi:hypothetical protein